MTPPRRLSWGKADVIIAAAITVIFSFVVCYWENVWDATDGAFAFYPPLHAIMYGVWLLPAILGGLLIRKPGAAFVCEFGAAIIGAFISHQLNATMLPEGITEAAGGEIGFAIFAYRSFGVKAALAVGPLLGLGAGLWDTFFYYASRDTWGFRVPMVVFTIASTLIVAWLGERLLTRTLGDTWLMRRHAAAWPVLAGLHRGGWRPLAGAMGRHRAGTAMAGHDAVVLAPQTRRAIAAPTPAPDPTRPPATTYDLVGAGEMS